MTRLDMSELGESHSAARMLGAPPGYVGHDSGGQLTEAVRRRPYQLVLLDEIEKAHPEVLLSLLPLLDEGRLTDGKGRTSDFTNTIIVMTSNLGVQVSTKRRVGFGEEASSVNPIAEAARRALPPELWNRIDEPIVFAPLDRDEVREIGRRLLTAVGRDLQVRSRIELCIDDSAVEALLEAGGFDPTLGARPMRRTVSRLVESPLASLILSGKIDAGAKVRVRGEDATIQFDVV
jgi:ATP-dependent Clp protease ATP-binding subunit ClpC